MNKTYHKGISTIAKAININLTPLTEKWTSIYKHRLKHRGKADAVKFMKELNTIAERYALRQSSELQWIRHTKDSFPKILGKDFKSFLRSKETSKVVMALSVMRTVESLRLPISKDISTVTNVCEYNSDVLNDIIDFIPQWCERIKPITLRGLKYHMTVKNGPNGHALQTSDYDIVAISQEPKLYEAIRKVEELLEDKYPMVIRSDIDKTISDKVIHSKLVQFPEKSGKTRTIAIVDYYSQRCLKTLHISLMSKLKSLVSDGTYSHENVGKYAEQKTKEKSFIYCADLTAATDRFPKEIQRVLLSNLIKDKDLSASLWTLLAERTFKVEWSGELVTYNCGQPMGAYSSWPLFALAHHLVVEYCAYKARCLNYKDSYRLIGDDVIITDERTATIYQDVMTKLGLTINQGKTVKSLSGSQFCGAEVAKQVYLNGKCLTPLTPGIVRDLEKPYMFNTCMRTLMKRYSFFSDRHPTMLLNLIFQKKGFKIAWLLASNPISGIIRPGNPGYDTFSPWATVNTEEVMNTYLLVVGQKLSEESDRLISKAIRFTSKERGSPWNNSTIREPLALKMVFEDHLKELNGANMHIMMNIMVGAFTQEDILDFVPDPLCPYMDRRELRQRRLSSIIIKVYDELKKPKQSLEFQAAINFNAQLDAMFDKW